VILGRVETLRLAEERGLLGGYNVADRNCEHLVNWCVAGDLDSPQVRKLWNALGVPISFALAIAVRGQRATHVSGPYRPAPSQDRRGRMQDPIEGRLRYLVHYSDGGWGMRAYNAVLDVGAEVMDGGARYRVEPVEPPPNSNAFGHVWVKLTEG
jgi:hypothetical protein